MSRKTRQVATVITKFDEIPFPIPPPPDDTTMCRDEYLEKFVKPYEIELPTSNVAEKEKNSEVHSQRSETGVAENLLIMQLVKEQRDTYIDELKLKKLPYHNTLQKILLRTYNAVVRKRLYYDVQNKALEMLCFNLIARLNTMEKVLPGNMYSLPHRLFFWSYEHFEKRLAILPMYLDLLCIENHPVVLDCLKFKIDLYETKHLVYAIRDDLKNGNNFCTHSMRIIQDACYDEHTLGLVGQELLEESRKSMATELFTRGTMTSQMIIAPPRVEKNFTQIQFNYDVLGPIEVRFRTKWARSQMDQITHANHLRCKVVSDQLHTVNEKMTNDQFTFQCGRNIYFAQIKQYQTMCDEWQKKLEEDLDEADLVCTTTRANVQKIRDEMQFYVDEVKRFKERITTIQILIAEEEERNRQLLEAQELALMERKSKLKTKKKK